jgi:glycosyltransferase involved in cell wall biosynthesis
LTGSRCTPSARFRVGQFVAPLAAAGISLDWRPAPVSEYPPAAAWRRPLWLPVTIGARLPDLARTWRSDLTLFNRELVSTLATLEGWTRAPRIFDVDDAIWLRRGGGYAARLARRMDLVVAGNEYLAEWFAPHCDRVEILPTAVDTARFLPRAAAEPAAPLNFGWSGTSSNHRFLLELEDALGRVLREQGQARLRVCSDREPRWRNLPAERVDFVPWSPSAEVAFFQSLDVGLMPLDDSPWTRGKCSYKMLLYLACGVPAVVSPVGMNVRVLGEAAVGCAATGSSGWSDAILGLLADQDARRAMGAAGRCLVSEKYSVDVISRQWSALMRRTAGLA